MRAKRMVFQGIPPPSLCLGLFEPCASASSSVMWFEETANISVGSASNHLSACSVAVVKFCSACVPWPPEVKPILPLAETSAFPSKSDVLLDENVERFGRGRPPVRLTSSANVERFGPGRPPVRLTARLSNWSGSYAFAQITEQKRIKPTCFVLISFVEMQTTSPKALEGCANFTLSART